MTMNLERESETIIPGFTAAASIGNVKECYSPTIGYMREDGKVSPQHIVCQRVYCFQLHGRTICTCV
jgi:hypothetical protein